MLSLNDNFQNMSFFAQEEHVLTKRYFNIGPALKEHYAKITFYQSESIQNLEIYLSLP